MQAIYIGIFISMMQMLSYCSAQHLNPTIMSFYPNSQDPGGVLALRVAQNQPLETFVFGSAHLEEARILRPHMQFRMASVSKHITAMAIYRLMEEGLVEINDPISKYFKGLSAVMDAVTVAHLLQHSSGIVDYEDLMPSDLQEPLSDADVLSMVRGYDRVYFPPGSSFRYSNTAYCLLALLVEQASGIAYTDYVKKNLFDAAGLQYALVYQAEVPIPYRVYGYHRLDGSFVLADQSMTSATKGDGGIYISALEMGQWLNRHHPQSLFKDDYWAFVLRKKILVAPGIFYSMGWFMSLNADGQWAFFHSGETTGFHNLVYYVPDSNQLLTLFTNRDDMQIAPFSASILAEEGIVLPSIPTREGGLFMWLSAVYAHQG